MALGFYFDQTRCIGCRACQIACKDRNDLAVGALYRRVGSYETGAYPHALVYHYSASCNHCDTPACVANCPTGAMQKSEDGAVLHDDEACIGCSTCVEACPYGVPVLLEDKRIVGKCDSCRALREAGENPACVDACIMRALDFGELADLQEKYGTDLVSEIAVLPSADVTNPNVHVKARTSALEPDFREMII